MKHALFDAVHSKYKRQNQINFEIGDDVVVTLRIIEGSKERLQDFEGVVIARRGSGLDEMFTVRRLVGDQGVERTFPIHSPKISAIRTVRSGKIRRCKLFYLRDRVGKARKLKARHISAAQRKAAADARAARQQAAADSRSVEKAAQPDLAGAAT